MSGMLKDLAGSWMATEVRPPLDPFESSHLGDALSSVFDPDPIGAGTMLPGQRID